MPKMIPAPSKKETEELTAAPSEEESDSQATGEIDWFALGNGTDEVVSPSEEEETVAEETSTEEESAEEETPPPATEESKEEEPPAKEETSEETPVEEPGTEETARQPEDTTPPVPTEAQMQAFLARQRTALEKHYQLPEDMADKLRLDPATVLPQLLAQVHMDATTQALHTMQGIMPNVVERVLTVKHTANEDENFFFETWPQLNEHRKAHPDAQEVFDRIGSAYRAANPNISRENFTKEVGVALMAAFKLPFEAEEQEQVPTGKATPLKKLGKKKTKPFKPAGAGGQAQATGVKSPWDDFIDGVAEEIQG